MPLFKNVRVFFFAFAFGFSAVAQTPVAAPPVVKASAAMTNDDVIALVNAGLGDEIVIAKIEAAPSTAFDVSIAGLKSLKAAGVSIAVVKTMISPPQRRDAVIAEALPDPDDFNQVQPVGVYALVHEGDGPGHLTKLAYTAPSRIAPAFGVLNHVKATLDGVKASVEFSDANPVFYVYPKTDDATTEREINTFQLVQFKVDKKGRELTLGTPSKASINEKSLTEIRIVQVKAGIYKITPAKPLEGGEYALYQGGTWRPMVGPVDGGSYFEFGVTGGKP